MSIAPYQVLIVGLGTAKKPEIMEAAARIYEEMQAAGIEVLFDDRDERAGVKFNDADLLGIPLRLTVGGRGLKSGVLELKLRRTGEVADAPIDSLIEQVQGIITDELALIKSAVVEEVL